jgi:uncharacterized alpha-E superfamily protein
MSRYLERAEHTARLLDVNLVLMLDQPPAIAALRWERLFSSLVVDPPADGVDDVRRIVETLTFDRTSRSSIMGSLGAARDCARQVRQQLSSETWEQLNRVYLRMSRTAIDDVWNAEPHAFFRDVQDGTHLIQGVADATMSRGEGWHFMQLGRFIERAGATAALIDAHRDLLDSNERVPGVSAYLDWIGLLKSRSAFEAYCQAYTADLRPDRIAEFLLLDPEFPRSARFAAAMVGTALRAIASSTASRKSEQVERSAGRLRAMLDYAHVDEILAGGAHAFAGDIQRLCAQVHGAIHESYFAPPLETILAS